MRRLFLLAAVLALQASAPAVVTAAPASAAKNEPALAIVADGGFELARVEPSSLARLPGGTVPLGRSAFAWAFSADRTKVAVGGQDGLQFVDVSAMRLLGRMSMARRFEVASNGGVATFFGVQPLAWLTPRRVLVLAPPHELLVVDPGRRRVIARKELGGWVGRIERTGTRLVLLVHAPERIAPARLVVADASGALRSVRVDRIVAGSRLEDAATHRTRSMTPGLAVDPSRERAYVVGAAGTVAEIPLATLRVVYREPSRPRSLLGRLHAWLEPEAQGKAGSGAHRDALWLGNGLLAVSGSDSMVVTSNGRLAQTSSPAGLKLIDTRSWTIRTLDERASSFVYSSGLLLASGVTFRANAAEGIGVVAYELDGTRRLSLFEGEPLQWAGAAGGYGYVPARAGEPRGVRIVDLADGSVVLRPTLEAPLFVEP
ncbi:MAG: hypothetical protein ACRDNB_10995 [Gaiellaceae bacterium]